MSSIEEAKIVINGVTLNADQVTSLWSALIAYKLDLLKDCTGEDRILRAASESCLPRVRSVEALFSITAHE